MASDDSDAYTQVGEAANEGIVAIVAAAALFVLPVDWARRKFTLNWNQATQIDWGTILLFGGGLVLGSLLSETGLAEVVGESIFDSLGVSSLFGITVVIVIVAVLVSETTSNTASAAIMVPIAISIAVASDINPTIPALAAIFGANYGFMLPVSTRRRTRSCTRPGCCRSPACSRPGRVRHHRRRPMRGGRDSDGQPGGPGVDRPGAHAPGPPLMHGRSPAPHAPGPPLAPGRSQAGLLRPSVLAIAAGAATVLPGFLVGALALQIRSDLDVSVGAVAAGVTVFFAAGAIGAGPGGRLAERTGALRAIRGCLVATAACLLAAALAGSLVVLLLLVAVAGMANAVSQPAINLFMADQVPLRRQGLAFGIKQSAIPAAVLVSGLALPLLALPLGWRPTFGLCALGALAVAAVVRRTAGSFVPPLPRPPAPRPSRALLMTAVGAALGSAAPNSLGAYLVASAVDIGIAEGTAGLLAAAGSAGSLVVRVVLGEWADRLGYYGFAIVVGLLATGSSGFALLASDATAAFVAGAVIAFALGWGWPGLFNLAVVDHNRHAPGAATGVTQTGIYLGAAGGPAAYGLLSTEFGYSAAWAGGCASCLLAACAFAYAARLRAM